MKKERKLFIFKIILPALLSLSLYFLFYLPIEFFLTEIALKFSKMNDLFNAVILFLFLIFTVHFNWDKIFRQKNRLIITLFIIGFSFGFYPFYRYEKISREYLPKIYSIDHQWVIQGQTLGINGINFGPRYKSGSVLVGENKFRIMDWNENKIMIEAPVPSRAGFFELLVITNENRKSNTIQIEVKDPNYLEMYLK